MARGKRYIIYKGITIHIKLYFSSETMMATRKWHIIFQMLRCKNCPTMNSLSVTILSKNEGRNKNILRGGKTKKICASKPTSVTKGRPVNRDKSNREKLGTSEERKIRTGKWLVEAKIITPSDVVHNVYRGDTQNH